jgi:NADH-ubiquinone oxidoreductase chain 5
MAAITKRAQIPFSAWLPAAMAAPTPVSALVHSSTLVTAGVYLLIRFNYMMGVNNFIFFVGVFTIFISGLGANYEIDLKKIIALSTLSQLGLMIMTLGIGYVEFSFFHLITHAIFKSLLFLCAGVFIHSMGDIQDIRIIGGLMISCPTTSFYFICSSIALCGVPFLSGFYSKDVILELYFSGGINSLMFIFIFLATMFTLTYSVRLIYFVFFNNFGRKILLNLEERERMLIPMRLLLAMSLFAGAFIRSTLFPIYFIYLPKLIKLRVLLMVLGLFIVILYFLQIKTVKSLGFTHLGSFFLGRM